jgi:hypothetical protein
MDSKLKKVLEKLLKHAPTQPLLYLFCSSENTVCGKVKMDSCGS